ncbi:RagB/SusD family nutrient uptake outer membrane protein [Sphingobacterium sp. MYb388]|uniref:RagB/SusD family nutrient uptake outer membrane protein n=1 Tax=Sphingobacterium sp. MYb388 TaxID=2745437 RepID=UPI0030A7D18E
MKNFFKIGLAIFLLTAISCDKFLDKKPDIKMAIPRTLADANLLLNDYATLNGGYPTYGEMGSDDYYLTQERWQGVSNIDHRNAYIWADEPYSDVVQWQRSYKTVYIANQVMEVHEGLDSQKNKEEYNRVQGGAYFIRAFAMQSLVEVHCPAYLESTASQELGIPLRSNTGVDDRSVRASLKDTYQQIISDFKEAINNLPTVEVVNGRPSKASAYAGLARAYLNMAAYQEAYLYADSCLQLKPELLDFNTLKATDTYPIPKFNVEVLFPALTAAAIPMNATTALIDTTLIRSYVENDLRKNIFFRVNNNPKGSYYFKGSYDKSNSLFFGITSSEVYLIKAEAACRVNKVSESLVALNKLLKTRWNHQVPYVGCTETDPNQLLEIILAERRKELIFRGRRWVDLKRLNLDSRFKKTLTRTMGDKVYTLEPTSNKYAFRLSETVIELAKVPQNKR